MATILVGPGVSAGLADGARALIAQLASYAHDAQGTLKEEVSQANHLQTASGLVDHAYGMFQQILVNNRGPRWGIKDAKSDVSIRLQGDLAMAADELDRSHIQDKSLASQLRRVGGYLKEPLSENGFLAQFLATDDANKSVAKLSSNADDRAKQGLELLGNMTVTSNMLAQGIGDPIPPPLAVAVNAEDEVATVESNVPPARLMR
jgi:hypothetical protein